MNPIKTLKKMGEDAPRLYLITTGAGAGIQQHIWAPPGISSFFIGAAMPYDTEETAGILGFTPDKWVSNETAVDLAQTAYMRAYKPGKRALGIGVTCSATSTRKHRGDHRIVVAGFTENACYTINLVIPKGNFWDEDRISAGLEPLAPEKLEERIEAQRIKDGKLADELALYLLGVMVGGKHPNNFQTMCELLVGEPLPEIVIMPAMGLAKSRILSHPYFRANGSRGALEDIVSKETVFYPGAYNPPHDGHIKGSKAAMQVLKHQTFLPPQEAVRFQSKTLIFCTTIDPPHKDALTPAEMLQRAVAMRGHNFLLTDGDPLYLDKAKRFQGAYFILGADALDRMMDPKWGVEPTYVLSQFERFGTKLLVLGRLVEGVFMNLTAVRRKHEAVIKGASLGLVFIDVPFRLDLSSSELRAKK